MSGKKDEDNTDEKIESEKPKTCFVIMPISDNDDYESGHFRRVYEYIIQPACRKAGFEPLRADEMAICDLSSRNPNVLYELGIRQSFDLPVTLIKDDVTPRIFDIQGFRDVFYHSNLRIDEVNKAVNELADAIEETYNNKGKEVNSIVELLGISKAAVKDPIDISPESSVLLEAIQQLRSDVIINRKNNSPTVVTKSVFKSYDNGPMPAMLLRNGEIVNPGDRIEHPAHGRGTIIFIPSNSEDGMIIKFDDPAIGRYKTGLYEPLKLAPKE
jgi:hypothetical protein